MPLIRLNKYLAESGICSRRNADELISEGRVGVNGEIITAHGVKIESTTDRVTLDGKAVHLIDKKIYLMLNKPTGVISSMKDQFNRTSVKDLVKDIGERLFHVGRLDYDTSGLLLLTNDGEISNKMMHPSGLVVKEYVAKLKGRLTPVAVACFQKGVDIGGYVTAPAELQITKEYGNYTQVIIRIHEGKNRQIRKMCQKIGHEVILLKRVAIGQIRLGTLKEGAYRHLTREEIEYLKQM